MLLDCRDARIAVRQVPSCAPHTIGIAIPNVTPRDIARACRIPIAAAELWIISVHATPTRTPIKGLDTLSIILLKAGTSCRGATELLIMSIPIIMTEKPMTIVPMDFFLSSLANIKKTTLPMARKGVKEDGFSSCSQKEPPSEFKLSSHAVAVVPRFAPIITPSDWDTFIMPELTRPTVITVVTEDCTKMDSAVPKDHAATLFSVNLSIRVLSRPPASCVRVSLITFMPNMKSASPLSMPVTSSKICCPLIWCISFSYCRYYKGLSYFLTQPNLYYRITIPFVFGHCNVF